MFHLLKLHLEIEVIQNLFLKIMAEKVMIFLLFFIQQRSEKLGFDVLHVWISDKIH